MRQILFSPPDITVSEIQEVADTLESGWITTGPKTKQFEKEIAAYCGTNIAVCLNSATACLECILRLLGIGEGDEVITSVYTYTASASPACHVGARLVLVDTQKDSYEMDYDALERAITPRTKVIIPVDIGGIMCDYKRIFDIAERKKTIFKPSNHIQEVIGRIVIVADAAHAFGADYYGRRCGSVADFTSFSFHAVKNLTTAEGGALTWRGIPGVEDTWIYQQFMLLSLHGQSKDALAKVRPGDWEYDIVFPAYKCNMTDIMAAIGLKQLERYEHMMSQRKRMIKMYDEALLPLGLKSISHYGQQYHSSGHLYMMRIPGFGESQRNEQIAKLAELGVTTNVHYKPLPMMTAYQELGFDISDYPNSFLQYQNEITLPLHTSLSLEDVQYVIQSVTKCMIGAGKYAGTKRVG